MREISIGLCEHCRQDFGYYIAHSGFGDCSYAYCDRCGMTAILSMWDRHWPKLSANYQFQREIGVEMEPHLQPCECGGSFTKGSCPRCPNCHRTLSPDLAATYLEANAPGTKKGWRWQRNWTDLYCIVIENRVVHDHFKNGINEIRS